MVTDNKKVHCQINNNNKIPNDFDDDLNHFYCFVNSINLTSIKSRELARKVIDVMNERIDNLMIQSHYLRCNAEIISELKQQLEERLKN